MSKNKTTSLAEKLWKESAEVRTQKVVERATILINLYYHLKMRSEDDLGANALSDADKKVIKVKLATIQRQLERIEKEVKSWQKDVIGELEQTLTIDHLTRLTSSEAFEKTTSNVAVAIHKLKL